MSEPIAIAIARTVQQAARAVVLHHPNSIACSLWRKVVLRSAEEMAGGLPTLGGMGILSQEDEATFEYQAIGPGKCLPLSRFEGAPGLDDGSALAVTTPLMEAQIALYDGLQQVQKGDLIALQPGAALVLAFEVISSSGSLSDGMASVAPALRYLLAPRDELHQLSPWLDG